MGFAFESQEKAGSTLQCFALGGPKLLDAGLLTTDVSGLGFTVIGLTWTQDVLPFYGYTL